MPLALYLDDCLNSKRLAHLLRQAGHSVVRPVEVGMAGQPDPVHFAYAVSQGMILVTKNSKDFEELHKKHSSHHGIFAIYQDNDVTKDMTSGDIVNAIRNLEAASQHGYAIPQEFHRLNDWR